MACQNGKFRKTSDSYLIVRFILHLRKFPISYFWFNQSCMVYELLNFYFLDPNEVTETFSRNVLDEILTKLSALHSLPGSVCDVQVQLAARVPLSLS